VNFWSCVNSVNNMLDQYAEPSQNYAVRTGPHARTGGSPTCRSSAGFEAEHQQQHCCCCCRCRNTTLCLLVNMHEDAAVPTDALVSAACHAMPCHALLCCAAIAHVTVHPPISTSACSRCNAAVTTQRSPSQHLLSHCAANTKPYGSAGTVEEEEGGGGGGGC
jgi:hypothetical protein